MFLFSSIFYVSRILDPPSTNLVILICPSRYWNSDLYWFKSSTMMHTQRWYDYYYIQWIEIKFYNQTQIMSYTWNLVNTLFYLTYIYIYICYSTNWNPVWSRILLVQTGIHYNSEYNFLPQGIKMEHFFQGTFIWKKT
jgi:hypothetical protein